MAFSLDRFYRLNRKAIIWIILFALIYLLRDFFTLIFLTFILSFFTFQVSQFIATRLRLSWSFSIIIVYLVLTIAYFGTVWWISPSVVYQISSLQAKLPGYQTKLNDVRDSYADRYPNLANLLGFNVESSLLNEYDIVDWPAFTRELSRSNNPASPPTPGKRIVELLPDRAKETINELKADYEQELAASLNRNQRKSQAGNDPNESNGNPESESSEPAVETDTAGDGKAIGNPSGHSIDALTSQTRPLERPQWGEIGSSPFQPPNERSMREASVIRALNEVIIKQRPFYSPAYFHLSDPDQQQRARSLASLSRAETEKFNRQLLELAYPEIIVKRRYVAEEKIKTLMDEYRSKLQGYIPTVITKLFDFVITSLLAILFSFLIVFDYSRLSREVQSLASSKLSDFYEEAGQPVVKFALSVGRGFQSIVLIGLVTMALLTPALMILRIPSIALLAVIIFVTSLVPVVGVIFQVVPIVLVALNENGPNVAMWALGATLVVHVITGYLIAPYVFGRQFKLNLVAVVFILFIANRVGGVWGMVLAVPVANYLLRDVFKVPFVDEKSTTLILSPIEPAMVAEKREEVRAERRRALEKAGAAKARTKALKDDRTT